MQIGGMRCFSWPIMACQREGEVEIFVGYFGEIFWEVEMFVVEENGRKEKILGKNLWLWRKERIKEMEKGKEIK